MKCIVFLCSYTMLWCTWLCLPNIDRRACALIMPFHMLNLLDPFLTNALWRTHADWHWRSRIDVFRHLIDDYPTVTFLDKMRSISDVSSPDKWNVAANASHRLPIAADYSYHDLPFKVFSLLKLCARLVIKMCLIRVFTARELTRAQVKHTFLTGWSVISHPD